MEKNTKSVFEILNAINVNEHTEKKGKLTYLPWAWAWAKVKTNYPNATYTIYENMNGMFYHTDGKTCWVKTGVTIEGIEYIEYLPVMDNLNKSIPLEKVTSFDVNTAIQRSLTKAAARHGLGLYIYAGEDLPDIEQEQPAPKPAKAAPKAAELVKTLDKAKERIMQFKTRSELEKFLGENEYQNLKQIDGVSAFTKSYYETLKMVK